MSDLNGMCCMGVTEEKHRAQRYVGFGSGHLDDQERKIEWERASSLTFCSTHNRRVFPGN